MGYNYPPTYPVMSSGSTAPMRASASTTPLGNMFGSLGKMNAPSGTPSTTAPSSNYTGRVAAGAGTYGSLGSNGPGPATGYAYNPATSPSSFSPTTSPASGAAPMYGSESGPGILDQWFNERATGTDPGYEYATKQGLTALDSAAAARGGYDSGAAEANDANYMAGMGAQREGQLDALASGASSERANQLATMLGFGNTLAGGQAGLGATYDTTGANAMSSANNAGLQYGAQAAMIPYLANQNLINQGMGLAGLFL